MLRRDGRQKMAQNDYNGLGAMSRRDPDLQSSHPIAFLARHRFRMSPNWRRVVGQPRLRLHLHVFADTGLISNKRVALEQSSRRPVNADRLNPGSFHARRKDDRPGGITDPQAAMIAVESHKRLFGTLPRKFAGRGQTKRARPVRIRESWGALTIAIFG